MPKPTSILTLKEILHIIVSEAKNSCTDMPSTLQYFNRYYCGRYNLQELGNFVEVLNFSAIRENSSALYFMTEKDTAL